MQASVLVRFLAMLSSSLVPTQEPVMQHAGGLLSRVHVTGDGIVNFYVDIQNSTYYGDVSFRIKIIDSDRDEPKNLIVLQADGSLDIKEIGYCDTNPALDWDDENRHIDIERRHHDPASQTLSIWLAKDLPDGANGYLAVNFAGLVRSDNRGIYKHQPSAEDDSVIKADFSNSSARLAVPCFDEPTIEPTLIKLAVQSHIDTITTSSSLTLRSRFLLRGKRLTMFEERQTKKFSEISFEIRPNPNDPSMDPGRNVTDLKNQPYQVRFSYDLMYNPVHDKELMRRP